MTSELDRLKGVLRSALAAEGESWWLPQPGALTVSALAVGTYHTNFLVKSGDSVFVARHNRSSQWNLSARSQLEREFATLLDLGSSGVTPLPLALLEGDETFLIESYIAGRPFDYAEGSIAVARAIARVHECEPLSTRGILPASSPLEFLVEDGESRLRRAEQLGGSTESTKVLQRVYERLTSSAPVAFEGADVIVHTDLIQSNILRTETGCALVDWEGARIGPRAWDLAYFLSAVTTEWARPPAKLPPSHHDDFVGAYAVETGVGVAQLTIEVKELMPYVMFRPLCWCAERLYSGEETDLDARKTLELLVSPQFLAERFGALLA